MRRWPWLASAVVATAPVHLWTARRIVDGSDEPWSLLAPIVIVGLLVQARRPPPERIDALAPALLLTAYALSYGMALPLVRGVLAMIALSLLLSRLYLGRRFDLGMTGLCVLTLPVGASLHFFLGYPLRAIVARLAAVILQGSGLAVTARGVGLSWGEQLVVVDAPCDGIKMLWVAAFLCTTLVAFLRLPLARALLGAFATLLLVVAGNALRAAALFYPEAGLVVLPELGHEVVGLAVFAAIALAVVAVLLRLRPQAGPQAGPQRDHEVPRCVISAT